MDPEPTPGASADNGPVDPVPSDAAPMDATPADAAAPAPTDPYVIYQLRKPSQRGTAVIPRFVPKTHAPAFSPANYRFARVWATADPAGASPASLLNAPRSFEYAGSLGSESSVWSDSNSWVSVSSRRTAQSDTRTPLLHSSSQPVSAASFFNSDFEHSRLRSSVRSPARSSDLESPSRQDFRYPPALSESVSEDAVIDDLLAMRNPPYPLGFSDADRHSSSSHPKNGSASSSQARQSATPPVTHVSPSAGRNRAGSGDGNNSSASSRAYPAAQAPNPLNSSRGLMQKGPFNRHAILPALTRKRRSLWQWLFCSDNAAASTTVPSVQAPPQRPQGPRMAATPSSKSRAPPPQNGSSAKTRDRVPGGDKEFLSRAHRAPDAPGTQRKRASSNRRMPSFEIRRGRPDHTAEDGHRSVSWNLVPKVFLNRDVKKKKQAAATAKQNARQPATPKQNARQPATPNSRKKKNKIKQDRPRGIAAEAVESPSDGENGRGHRIAFQKNLPRKEGPSGLSKRPERNGSKTTRQPEPSNPIVRKARPQDRPREDRPRPPGQGKESSSGAPIQKSVVPSLREKTGGSSSSHSQRMRSGESSDQVTSRISSDLTNTTIERSLGSGSSHSTPVLSRSKYHSDSHELDPAANGVSSDVSSHVSGVLSKASPRSHQGESTTATSGIPSSIDCDAMKARRISRSSPFRPELFAFPSFSSGSGGYADPNHKSEWESPPGVYPEYGSTPVQGGSDATDESFALGDPVARAMEKNRARSAGGPLSYLMKQPDTEMDVNTQSTGLTSLADESVSTHKTISAVDDDYRMMPTGLSSNRYPYLDAQKIPRPLQSGRDAEISDGSGTGRPIFQNSALFNYSGRISPSGVSSASPRRFHSDWSDPHATDIDVYCQCSCTCVYEEECRRNCELVYGRSPSVSSTRSCSRRGYPGFQTLPPAINSGVTFKQRMPSPNVAENSNEPFAFRGRRTPGSGHAEESRGNAQKSYIRASALDELPDPRTWDANGQTASDAYVPGRPDYHMTDIGATGAHGPPEPAYTKTVFYPNGDMREEHYSERRKIIAQEAGVAQIRPIGETYQETRGTDYNTHNQERSRRSYPVEVSPRRRAAGKSEGNTTSSAERSKSASRRTPVSSGSSRQSSTLSKRNGTPRSATRDDTLAAAKSGKRQRELEALKRHGRSHATEGPQQMGNSFVVKRNGMPPFGQTNIPQPYRASGYGRDVSYEFEEDGVPADVRGVSGTRSRNEHEGNPGRPELGPTPVVQLEFDTGSIGSHEMGRHTPGQSGDNSHRSRSRNAANGYESRPRQGSRTEGARHGQKKTAAANRHHAHGKGGKRPTSKHAQATSRSNPKGTSRSRTPLFGLF